jgi:Ca2+-binding EF-hand superfamily protein
MKKTTTLATVVAVTLMGSALCHAQAADPKKKQFEKLDADKNGLISLEEFKAKSKTPDTADAKFAKIDADKNGSVSLEEWSAGSAKKKKPAEPAAE